MDEATNAAVETAVRRMAREAARQLAAAEKAISHESGRREQFRELVARALEDAGRALVLAEAERAAGERRGPSSIAAARLVLAKAHAANARDALHGAGQLSQSAQRAPTCEACDDGWRRVEAIVAGAEESARLAAVFAAELEQDTPGSAPARSGRTAALRAQTAARAARELVTARNHAYTFHADGGFSFGEGWYLAAAALLAGVDIQVEPGKAHTLAAETFLRDAGLAEHIRPYRSRPRAMKHTTTLVARAFREDALSAQRRLRASFLGNAAITKEAKGYIDARIAAASGVITGKKVLVWIRDGVHHANRNTLPAELLELTARVQRAGLVPIWTGDALAEQRVPAGVVDTIFFWKEPVFRGEHMRRAQLQFFEYLRESHGLVGQLGVTTAGMDGPALLGLPTLYLTETTNVRMREWVGAVPGYEEVVRETGYLERISRVLDAWATTGGREGS